MKEKKDIIDALEAYCRKNNKFYTPNCNMVVFGHSDMINFMEIYLEIQEALKWWRELPVQNLEDMEDSWVGYGRKYYTGKSIYHLTNEEILYIYQKENIKSNTDNYKIMNTEKDLLEIAKEIISLNENLSPTLTGSLMLYVRGVNKRREAHDIDILINQQITQDWFEVNQIVLPEGFIQASPAYPDSIKFTKDEISLDILYSEEPSELINGVNCVSIANMVDRKYYYAINNIGVAAEKHRLDLEFMGYVVPPAEEWPEL